MQAVLLRFLETGEIQRVGGNSVHTRVDVRLITATNRDLQQQIATGAFREDLYFRLNVIRIFIPPLRDRIEDLPLLLDRFLATYSDEHRLPRPDVSPSALEALQAHRWPGNVRELKNVVERVVLRVAGRTIGPNDLPSDLLFGAAATGRARTGDQPPVPSVAEDLSIQMLRHGQSFWAVAYPLFMSRDLTRADLRRVIQIGLENTNGNYRLLVQLFNMPADDYKKFLGFLRKHDCHLPFQRFRTVPAAAGIRARHTPVNAA